jgi:predicted DCC family thiol-disulfide oxidoreductase YuxK
VIGRDRKKRFSFQALGDGGSDPDTVLLEVGGKTYMRSTAILRIATQLPFPWPVLGIFFLVPRKIRDALYDWVARNRKKWFGARSTCYIPGDQDQPR